jgi:hypothetical protein
MLGVFHNIAIPYGNAWLFRGPPARSTEPVTFTVPPLPGGEYPFLSEARPSMGGSFEISDQPAG